MTEERLFIDTNILVYAFDLDSDKHAKARDVIVKALIAGRAVLSAQVLAEFARVVTEKVRKPISYDRAREAVKDLDDTAEMAFYTGYTVQAALQLCDKHKVHFFDALIAATMFQENVKTILTENEKDFAKIPGVHAVNPFK